MEQQFIFGDTPVGIIILDIIGAILVPILFGVFKRLGSIAIKLTNCLDAMTASNATLAKVVEELNDARVRDTAIEGRIKGLDDKFNAHIRGK